jgi:hypothetical protein
MYASATSDASTFAGRRMVFLFATTGTAFLSAAGHFVDGGPSTTLGFLWAKPS